MALLGYWPPAAHLAIVAACAATAWWRIETAPAASPGAAPADLAAPAAAAALAAAEARAGDWQGDVQVLEARALFRPVGPASEDVTATAPTPGPVDAGPPFEALRMVGYVDQGGRRSAILVTVQDGQTHVAREGDEVAGARVTQIGPDAVEVEAGGQRIVLRLYPD